MSDENVVVQTADLSTAGATRLSVAGRRERNFWIALGCAALLHASIFLGVLGSKPQEVGDPNGDDNAISVSLITEKDLDSRSSAIDPATPPPGQPAEAQPQPPPPQPQAEAQPQPQQEAKQEPPAPDPQPPEPQEQPKDVPDAKDEPTPTPPDQVKPEAKAKEQKTAKDEGLTPEESANVLFTLPDMNSANPQSAPEEKKSKSVDTETEPAKAAPKKTAKKQQQQKKTASLDLSDPAARVSSFTGSGEAAFQRPPGITKSGVNDQFARNVIRALQQSMPQLMDVQGRVQVRILLSESGNVVSVDLVRGATNSSLNQNVVFAARQTSYPIPPVGSNLADRTFLVTYIYD